MKKYNFLLIVLAIIVLAHSCKCTGGPQLMPNVSGKAGEVVVVMNKGSWDGEAGVAIRNALGKDVPYLPQREPMFTLATISESAFTNIFQTHRNLVIIRTLPEISEPRIVFQENVWAAPQLVVTISVKETSQIAEVVKENEQKIASAILMAERNRIIQNAKRYPERVLREKVAEQFGGAPYFPTGYSLKKETDNNFMWISYETTYTNQGIFIYTFPFRDSSDFEKGNLIAKRNEIMAKNVPGQVDRSYMTTNMLEDPGLRWVSYNKRVFAELRGLWEVQNDFMGGPFVSHFFRDKSGKNIIGIEAFVYAPRYDKRNYLRQVEALLYSFEFF